MTRFCRSSQARLLASVFLALAAAACDGDPATQAAMEAPPPIPGMKGNPAVGARIYQSNCTACHSPNPAFPGVLGPEVKGSSRELIEARVMHARYPDGYSPKRGTHNMVAMPQLEPYLDDLAAYLH